MIYPIAIEAVQRLAALIDIAAPSTARALPNGLHALGAYPSGGYVEYTAYGAEVVHHVM
jgi:hypothetical protein